MLSFMRQLNVLGASKSSLLHQSTALSLLLLASCDVNLGDQQGEELEEGSVQVTLVGYVIDSNSEETISDASVEVFVVGADLSTQEAVSEQVMTLENGRFTVPSFVINSLKNRYKIIVSKQGYRTNDDTTLFALLPGEINTGTIRLQSSDVIQRTRVSGTVVSGFEGDNRALEGAQIQLSEARGDGVVGANACETQSDSMGRFMCEGLLLGEYQLNISLEGHSSISETIAVFQQLELGPQRLYNNDDPRDLTIVLDWTSPSGLRVDLDLWLDIANTHPMPNAESEQFEPIRFGVNDQGTYDEPSDLIQRASGFAKGTPYWPFSATPQRVALKQSHCGYPLLNETDEVLCSTLTPDQRAQQYFVQFRRNNKDGTEPEVVSIFGDTIPFPDDFELELARMYRYVSSSDPSVTRHPIAMAAVVVSTEEFEILDFDGLNAEMSLPASSPTVKVYKGTELIGAFSIDEVNLPLGENINQWIPLMIEYGVTQNDHLYFEVHPVGKTEQFTEQKLWVYEHPENNPIEQGGRAKVVEPLGMASSPQKAVTMGWGQSGRLAFDVHEGSRLTNHADVLTLNLPTDLPNDFEPRAISITGNTVNVAAVNPNSEIKLFLGLGRSAPCGVGSPNVIIPYGNRSYFIGTDQGLSPCVINDQVPELDPMLAFPQTPVTSSGVVPNSPWLLIGGEAGLFASLLNDQRPLSGLEVAGESVVAIHEDIVAFESGQVFIVTNNLALYPITDQLFNDIHAIQKSGEFVLVSDGDGLHSIEIVDLRSDIDLLGLDFQNSIVHEIPSPSDAPVRHLSSLNGVGYFYDQGQLREIQ